MVSGKERERGRESSYRSRRSSGGSGIAWIIPDNRNTKVGFTDRGNFFFLPTLPPSL